MQRLRERPDATRTTQSHENAHELKIQSARWLSQNIPDRSKSGQKGLPTYDTPKDDEEIKWEEKIEDGNNFCDLRSLM